MISDEELSRWEGHVIEGRIDAHVMGRLIHEVRRLRLRDVPGSGENRVEYRGGCWVVEGQRHCPVCGARRWVELVIPSRWLAGIRSLFALQAPRLGEEE